MGFAQLRRFILNHHFFQLNQAKGGFISGPITPVLCAALAAILGGSAAALGFAIDDSEFHFQTGCAGVSFDQRFLQGGFRRKLLPVSVRQERIHANEPLAKRIQAARHRRAASPTVTPKSLPTVTETGIAARYPGDKNIGSDPNVILADDFEAYTSPDQLKEKWDGVYRLANLRIDSEIVYGGGKSLEMQLPVSAREVSNALVKNLSPEQDTVFLRCYTRFDPDYNVVATSTHNGIRLSAHYPGPGITPNQDGTGFFLFLLQNSIRGKALAGESIPGYSHLYVYWPEQRMAFGDHWYPDGTIKPGGKGIGNKGEWLAYPDKYPDFKPMPHFLPKLDQWYCYELMVRANTPGKSDGEVKYWVDGKLVSAFPNLNLRSVSTLKMDQAKIGLHAKHSERVNKKWYDNVVIATKYIGPMEGDTN